MRALLGDIPGGDQEKQDAARLATLSMRMGGLGFRAAVRMAPAAYWASWADALPMLQERLPVVAQNAVNVLDGDANVDGCLGEVRQAAAGLDRQGFIGRPQREGTSDGSETTSTDRFRTWLMGTRLATPRGFRFRVPLLEVRGVCTIVSIAPGSSPLTLRQWLFPCASRVSHQTRVQD